MSPARSPGGAAGSADARFLAISRAEWKWRRKQIPPDEDSDAASVPSSLPDVGEAQQKAKLDRWLDVLVRIEGLAGLSPERSVDCRVYRHQIECLVADQKFKTYQRPLSADTSFWGDVSNLAKSPFRSEGDYCNYIEMLNDIPRYFDQNIANMRAGLARGFTLPQIALAGRDASVAHVLDATDILENPYFLPFKAMPSAIDADLRHALCEQAASQIAQKVLPAYSGLLRFLRDEYIPQSQASISARDLPEGENFYQSQIAKYTTLELAPDEIHALGLAEVASIREEMSGVMAEVHFAGELCDFMDFLRRAPQFYAAKPQNLLNFAAWIAKQFDGKAATYFGRLPRQRFAIVPVPADVAPFFTGGRGGRTQFMVNTYDLASRPLYSLPALTLHESAPGHSFQMALAGENKDLPPFRREVFISAYGEGWAVYSERLGDEMGLYETPYERFGMLNYQMWRAARLVVDTGIHTMGWSRELAQQYLRDNTALAEHEITTEVDRYIAWPAQALSYYLGAMDFWRNRRRAEAALGGKFNLRAFHDTLLALGSVPLDVVDEATDKFIAGSGAGPYPDEE